MGDTHRWNVEATTDGVRICYGQHDRADDCDWVEYVPAGSVQTIEHDKNALHRGPESGADPSGDIPSGVERNHGIGSMQGNLSDILVSIARMGTLSDFEKAALHLAADIVRVNAGVVPSPVLEGASDPRICEGCGCHTVVIECLRCHARRPHGMVPPPQHEGDTDPHERAAKCGHCGAYHGAEMALQLTLNIFRDGSAHREQWAKEVMDGFMFRMSRGVGVTGKLPGDNQ